jgi:hypothetical protein
MTDYDRLSPAEKIARELEATRLLNEESCSNPNNNSTETETEKILREHIIGLNKDMETLRAELMKETEQTAELMKKTDLHPNIAHAILILEMMADGLDLLMRRNDQNDVYVCLKANTEFCMHLLMEKGT